MPHTEGHATPVGRTILEITEEKLKTAFYELSVKEDTVDRAYLNGKMDGLAIAISVFLNPYNSRPDLILASLKEELPQVSEDSKETPVTPAVEVDTEWVL